LSTTTSLPPPLTLFPYTTLFRSSRARPAGYERMYRVRPRQRRQLPAAQAPGSALAADVALHAVLDGAALRRVPGLRRGQRLEPRSEEHTSELQSRFDLVCRLLLE